MADEIDVLLTGDRFGWTAESPQLPGLIVGRPTETELKAALRDALKAAGVEDDTSLRMHQQWRGDAADGSEYVIRFALGAETEPRRVLARRVKAMLDLGGPNGRELLSGEPSSATGEVVFICALATETLGMITRQLDSRSDMCVIAVDLAGTMVFTTRLGSGEMMVTEGWTPLHEIGWTLYTTLGDVMKVLTEAPAERRALLV